MAKVLKQQEKNCYGQGRANELEDDEQAGIVTIDSDQVLPDRILFSEGNDVCIENDKCGVVNGDGGDEAYSRIVPPA